MENYKLDTQEVIDYLELEVAKENIMQTLGNLSHYDNLFPITEFEKLCNQRGIEIRMPDTLDEARALQEAIDTFMGIYLSLAINRDLVNDLIEKADLLEAELDRIFGKKDIPTIEEELPKPRKLTLLEKLINNFKGILI